MIRFEVLVPADIPEAVISLVETMADYPANYEAGPFDDATLISERVVFVTGADEVEAAQLLTTKFGDRGVRWRAL